MAYLSEHSKKLIGRINNTLLLGIIQNLAYSIKLEETFFLPTAELQAAWFEREIDMLSKGEKLDLIKELCDQTQKNYLEAAK